jgi:hypothetical protein
MPSSSMPVESPSSLSYSRKDHYFAESLAFQLMRQGRARVAGRQDLEPGEDWERGLEEALDAATTVVLVGSPDSMESPNVRNEWQRALRHRKRIVLARFRGVQIPAELQQCESVDFRLPFGRALSALVACLTPAAPAAAPRKTAGTPAVHGSAYRVGRINGRDAGHPSLAYPLRGLVRAAGMRTERESGAALPARDRAQGCRAPSLAVSKIRTANAWLDGHVSGVNI